MSKGNSGYFGGTNGTKIIAGSSDFMHPSDNFSKFIKNRKDIDVDGVYDIIAHGTSNSMLIQSNGQTLEVSHRLASRIIKNQIDYKGGAIRLLSCNTGTSTKGFAQNLANKLNVVVEAPNKYLWVDSNGNYFVAGMKNGRPDYSDRGKFIKFYPGGKKK